jgi:hypothetical protein
MAKAARPASGVGRKQALASVIAGIDHPATKQTAHRQAPRPRDAQPFSQQPTPAAELAVEQRNAEIKRRNALITEAKLERRRRKRKKGRASLATLRVCELYRLFFVRYRGHLIPDDDDGRDSVWIFINHLAMLASPAVRIEDWLSRCAPWFHDQAMIDRARAKPQRWRADTMAEVLNVTDEERTRLKTWTIGAVDCDKDQRAARRREKNRLAKEARRRADGALPRAQSLSQTKPWEAEGISRRQWERRRMSQLRVQHISAPTVPAFATSVPEAPLSDAGSPPVLAMAERHPPPRMAPCFPSTAEVGVSLRTAPNTVGCNRISGTPVSNFDQAQRVRAAILEEAARHEAERHARLRRFG